MLAAASVAKVRNGRSNLKIREGVVVMRCLRLGLGIWWRVPALIVSVVVEVEFA